MSQGTRTNNKVVKKAVKEIGYLEKETNAYLNSKKLNAGDENYTKYGKWYGLNGQAWCCMFISWLFYIVYGYAAGKEMLYGVYQASCEFMRQQFIKAGKYHPAKGYTPKKGDLIFFWTSSSSRSDHIGIVERVPTGYVGTIEGNTSAADGVVWNGGGVARKTYKQDYYKILGYGTPKYDKAKLTAPDVVLHEGAEGAAVKKLQRCLNKVLKFTLKVDGIYGEETRKAVKQFKVIYELENDNGKTYGKKMRKALNKALKECQ